MGFGNSFICKNSGTDVLQLYYFFVYTVYLFISVYTENLVQVLKTPHHNSFWIYDECITDLNRTGYDTIEKKKAIDCVFLALLSWDFKPLGFAIFFPFDIYKKAL